MIEAKAGRRLTWRYLCGLCILCGLRLALPTGIFAALPPILMTCVEILPTVVLGTLLLNRAFPAKTFPPSSYGMWLLLLIPMAALYNTVRMGMIAGYPALREALSLPQWSLPALLLDATSTLLLNGLVALSFVVLWKAAFSHAAPFPLGLGRLLNPLFWVAAYLGAVLLHYCDFSVHLQNLSTTRMQISFGGPGAAADWLRHGPVLSLVLTWAQTPVEVLLLGLMVLMPMRLILRAGRKAAPGATQVPPRRPSYFNGPSSGRRTPGYLPREKAPGQQEGAQK